MTAQLNDMASSLEHQTPLDFVTHLPIEILLIVFSAFTTKELALAAMVSHAWYNRITQCAPLWRSIIVDADDEAIWVVIPHIGEHVRDAYYRQTSDRLYELYHLEETKCEQKEIDNMITEYIKKKSQAYHDTTYMKYLYWEEVPTDVFLHAFPNLQRFESRADILDKNDPGSFKVPFSASPPYQHLTTLKLTAEFETSFEETHLDIILRRCPMLRRLTLFHCSWDKLDFIQQNSNLEVLVINLGTRYMYENSLLSLHYQLMAETNSYTQGRQETGLMYKGLRSLALHASSNYFSEDEEEEEEDTDFIRFTCHDIAPLVVSNRDSIEELIITYHDREADFLHGMISTQVQWNTIFKTSFVNLQRLACIVPDNIEYDFFNFLRQYGNQLIDCSIYHPFKISKLILSALAASTTIRRLVLVGRTFDFDGFQKILQCIDKGWNNIQHICLKDIQYSNTDNILNAVVTTKNLRGFEIDNTRMKQSAIEKFMMDLDTSGTIGWLILKNIRYTPINTEEVHLDMQDMVENV